MGDARYYVKYAFILYFVFLGRDLGGSGAARGSGAGQLAGASRAQPGRLAAASWPAPRRESLPWWSTRPGELSPRGSTRFFYDASRPVKSATRPVLCATRFVLCATRFVLCATRFVYACERRESSVESARVADFGALIAFAKTRPRCRALARCRNTIREAISRDSPSGPLGLHAFRRNRTRSAAGTFSGHGQHSRRHR